jgi:hypothetical protein
MQNKIVLNIFLSGWLILCLLITPNTASPQESSQSQKNEAIHPVYNQLLQTKPNPKKCFAVENLTIKKDTATIHFANGEIYLLELVNHQITGLVFVGQGTFQLPVSLESEKNHLQHLLGKQETLNEPFTQMVLRFTDSTWLDIEPQVKKGSGDKSAKADTIFTNFSDMLKKGRKYNFSNIAVLFLQKNYNIRLLQDLLSDTKNDFFMAFFNGKTYGDFLFMTDPMGIPYFEPEQVALIGLSQKNLGVWYCAVANQPVTSAASTEKPPLSIIDVLHYTIESNIIGKKLIVKAELEFIANDSQIKVLPLDLTPKLRVTQVVDQQHNQLSYIQEPEDLGHGFAILLNTPLKKGETSKITVYYSGNESVVDYGNGNFSLIHRHNWFPNPGFGKDRALFKLIFHHPKDITLLGSSELTHEENNEKTRTSVWESSSPQLTAGFNYGKFVRKDLKEESTGTAIETYANKELPDSFKELQLLVGQADMNHELSFISKLNTLEIMDKASNEALIAIAMYSKMFGPLPAKRMGISQQPFLNFGQAWPQLVYLPILSFFADYYRHILDLDSISPTFFKTVNAHEVAHQWWGHLVSPSDYRSEWIIEGLAQFSASLFCQAVYGHGTFVQMWKEFRQDLTKKTKKRIIPVKSTTLDMGGRCDTVRTGNLSFYMFYCKAPYIFHMLRMMMWDPKTGDEKLYAFLKDVISSHKDRPISITSLQEVAEKHMVTNMNLKKNGKLDWFFRQWVYGCEIPKYSLDYKKMTKNDKKELHVKVTQSEVDNEFCMPVPIYARFGKDKIIRLCTVHLFGNSSQDNIIIPVPEWPKEVMLNAREDILCL